MKPAIAAGLASVGALALAPAAQAQQLVLDSASAKVALEPYAAPATVGSRAQLSAELGTLDTSVTAAIERGGGSVRGGGDAWTEIYPLRSWISNDVQFGANWALASGARLSLEAGDRQRWTRDAEDAGDGLAIDGSRYLRIGVAAGSERLNLKLGAETSRTALDTEAVGQASAATRQWITSRRLAANLTWRPSPRISLEGGESAQSFTAGWQGATSSGAADTYLTPNVAVTLTPWTDARWRLEAEETLSPIDPSKFAAYAQIATPGAAYAPQPDHGWRYGLKMEQQLPARLTLIAQAAAWRLASVTELGPVGAGEAPVGVGPGQRREVAVSLAAPLSGLGLPRATVAGEVTLRRSEVTDPFTGQRRELSGEAPYAARLRVAGALPAPDLSWSLTAQADGPQRLYQMVQVTNLGPTTGLGGALTYGAGPLKLSLELDNLLGGARDVTTLTYAGSRAEDSVSGVARRKDEARAVRIALRKGL
jgi:hypothetical protein